tara:strand:+ start:105 stop:629 length:525 start_codon:yes stop_codon:yes gene_type:complete
MTTIIALFFSLFLSFGSASEKQIQQTYSDSITTYYLIRHAEKDRSDSTNKDPNLTNEGKERAKKWTNILKDIKFDAVYSTNYNRTKQTAKPLAESQQLDVKTYEANNLYNDDFKKLTKGKTVLVVGHSNTTPQFANAILGEKKYENIDDSENGALFIVHVLEDGSKISQVIYIN